MVRLISLLVQQKDISCSVFEYNTYSIKTITFTEFVRLQIKGEVQNFKLCRHDNESPKIECSDGSAKWIIVNYLDREAMLKYHELIQSGMCININSLFNEGDIDISSLRLPKFRQIYDKPINPINLIHILAKVIYKQGSKELRKYLIYHNGSIKTYTVKELDTYIKSIKPKVKFVNAKLFNGRLCPIKGIFVDIHINLDNIHKEINSMAKKNQGNTQEYENSHRWNTILSYSKLGQHPIKEQIGYDKLQNIGFYGSQVWVDFDNCYKDQRYRDILQGHNKFLILMYSEKIQVDYISMYTKRWLDRVLYILDESDLDYVRYKPKKPLIQQIIHSNLNKVHSRLKQSQQKNNHNQEAWLRHYKRTVKSIQENKSNFKSNEEFVSLLKDCIEYRIKNDSKLKRYLKPLASDVNNILQCDKISMVILLAAYIDFIYTSNFGNLPVLDESSLVAQAIRTHYIINFKLSIKDAECSLYKSIIYNISKDTEEILRFIQHTKIQRDAYKNYAISQPYDSGCLSGQAQCVKHIHRHSQICTQDQTQLKNRHNTPIRVQQYVILNDLRRTYLDKVQELKYEYIDLQGTVWTTTLQQTQCFVENDADVGFDTELFINQDIRKVRDDLYLMCEYVEHRRQTCRWGHADRPEQRLIFVKDRVGKTGNIIKDIIYVPFKMLAYSNEYNKHVGTLDSFNIKIDQILNGNKVYYVVHQNSLVQFIAPQTINFDDYKQFNVTSDKSYSSLNTDRPLVFTVFGKYALYNNLYTTRKTYTGVYGVNSNGETEQYLSEVKKDLDNLIKQYKTANGYI